MLCVCLCKSYSTTAQLAESCFSGSFSHLLMEDTYPLQTHANYFRQGDFLEEVLLDASSELHLFLSGWTLSVIFTFKDAAFQGA